MNKKFISLVLAFVMVLGTFTSVFAAETVKKEEVKEVPKITENDKKVQWLLDNKIVEGHKISKDGKEMKDVALDENITRAQVSKLIIYSLGKQDLAEKVQSVKIYKDVEASHWANGFIIVGSTTASPVNPVYMLVGYPDGSFGPEKNVTYAELAKMLVVLVKKDLTQDMTNKAIWPASWLKWAAELGILEGLKIEDANKAANRKDAFVMLYNALYVMKYIEKEPANETLGIISKFEKDKLTLNQGDKAKTFTLDKETNFVTLTNPTVKAPLPIKQAVSEINSYYYGSLVRLIADKDGKVTHILELGNPDVKKPLANDGAWKHVADHAVKDVTNATLTVSGSDIKNITVGNKTLDLVKGTRYFVADVVKNQLTEVDGVEKALAIVGYDKVNGQKIPNVYAGYDLFKGEMEAKVVVFNNVEKDNNAGEMLRVRIEADSKYDVVLENTKGEVVITSLKAYNAYPFNYKDAKYDVVNHKSNFNGNYFDNVVIDHSKAPILEVLEKDGREVKVTDGRRVATLVLASDAKVFTAKESFVKGAKIQVALNSAKTRVTVVSILPEKEAVKGDLKDLGIVGTSNALFEAEARDIEVVVSNNQSLSQVNLKGYKQVNDKNASYLVETALRVSKDEAEALKAYLETAKADAKVRFSIKDKDLMFNVEVMVGEKWVAVTKAEDAQALLDLNAEIATAKKKLENVKESVDGTDVATTDKWVTAADMTTFTDAIKAAEKDAAEKTTKADFDAAKGTLNAAIGAFAPQAGTKA